MPAAPAVKLVHEPSTPYPKCYLRLLYTTDGRNRPHYDKHHISGKANSDVTILVPVNDHRAQISVDQYDWPKRTLENPEGSPLLLWCRLHSRICRYCQLPE